MFEIALGVLFTYPFYKARNFLVAAKLLERKIDLCQSPFVEDRMDLTMTNSVNFKFIAATVHFWYQVVLVE